MLNFLSSFSDSDVLLTNSCINLRIGCIFLPRQGGYGIDVNTSAQKPYYKRVHEAMECNMLVDFGLLNPFRKFAYKHGISNIVKYRTRS